MSEKSQWHDDDAFWETFDSVLFGRERWDKAPQEVEQVMALLQVESGDPILDLCCGVGRHALEFARGGFRVTGVDRTAAYLDEARRRAGEEGLEVEWVCEDMRSFRCPGAFAGAVNLFTALGYFEDPSEDRRVLENLYASLQDNGVLVIDIISKEVLARKFRVRDWDELEDGTILLRETKLEQHWSWAVVRWIRIKDGEQSEFRFGHRLYSASELAGLLSACGFRSVEVYGDLAGAPYDHEAKRLVAVARK